MGRHRTRDSSRGTVAAGLAVAVVLSAAWVGYRQSVTPSCTGRSRLVVAVSPDLAAAVRAAAGDWSAANPSVDGVCVAVEVTGVAPVEVAAAVAARYDVRLTGLGEATGTVAVPDVWVPDSSAWLVRLRAAAPEFRPLPGGPVAHSPVVLAVPEPVARNLGWLDATIGWADVLREVTGPDRIRVGTVDPTRDAAGLSGVLALGASAATRPDAANVTTAALRSVAAGGSAIRDALLASFPRGSEPAQLEAALGAAVLSEADVIRYDAARPPVPLVAVRPEPAAAPLDHPYAVLPGADPVKAAAANGLRRELSSARFRAGLGALGLRVPDGSAGAGFLPPAGPGPPATDLRASPAPGGAGLAVAEVDRLLATWTVVTGPARMLAVIDVSGTMLRRVPTAGNISRLELTVQTARRGLALLDDTWSLGLWVFSSRLDGSRDHRELVPIGLLSTRRTQVQQMLTTIRADRRADTGLFDTVLAAYQTLQDDWVAGQANSVVLFTDGAGNDDPAGGLSEAELLARLRQIADPRRPVQVVLIGIGDAVDRAGLERIAAATGGSAFVATDPARIGEIFLQAVAARPVRPR